jgi:EPS-associated MarR family transcriptional regulator
LNKAIGTVNLCSFNEHEPTGDFCFTRRCGSVEKTFKMVGNLKKKERNVSQEITLQLMAHVEQNPQDTQRAIASELGVSLGSVNYCIKALINKGFLKVENFRKSSNKLGYAYLLTPSGIGEKANLTLSFLKRKQQEYNRLEREIAELQEEVAKLEERKSS